MSWLLRHGAVQEGLHVSANGFINLTDILNHKSFKSYYSIDDIIRVVKSNDKQRFSLQYTDNELLICANQGHSLQVMQ